MQGTGRASVRATDARERLLLATLDCARRDGAGALSLQHIAREARVSKALVLYHFHDKERLLVAVIEWLTERLVVRERVALSASTATSVLEDYWQALDREFRFGELRVLIELSQERGVDAVAALGASARRRRSVCDETISRVFQLLELSPRLPTAMLAACELAFREGLVLSAAREAEHSARVSFDVFWLSLLGLAQ